MQVIITIITSIIFGKCLKLFKGLVFQNFKIHCISFGNIFDFVFQNWSKSIFWEKVVPLDPKATINKKHNFSAVMFMAVILFLAF